MTGSRFFVLAVAAFLFAGFLTYGTDGRTSVVMRGVSNEVQLLCKRYSSYLNGVQVGCRSFADVRKIEMRSDNRERSASSGQPIRINR